MPVNTSARKIATPAMMAKRSAIAIPQPRHELPALGHDRHPDATYWLETNAGIAFQHVGRLDLLPAHYVGRLQVVDDVYGEWERWSDPPPTAPSQYASRDEHQDYDRKVRIWRAAKKLYPDGEKVLGPMFELPVAEATAVDALRVELANLPVPTPPPAAGDHWRDRGECASVRGADLRGDTAVLATNDAKASRLAHNHGIATRTTAEVLREMVLAGTGDLTAAEAWAMHQTMTEVTQMARDKRPAGPEYFAS